MSDITVTVVDEPDQIITEDDLQLHTTDDPIEVTVEDDGIEVEVTDTDQITITFEDIEVNVAGDEVIEVTVDSGAPGPQGPAGPPGSALTAVAAVSLGGHRAVTLDSSGELIYGDAATILHSGRIIGITTGASSPGDTVEIVQSGPVTEPSWSWDTGVPIYVGLNGLLTQTPPSLPGSAFSQIIGWPVDATTAFIEPQTPIKL